MGKTALIQTIAMTLGGRAAEDLVFHEVTTGASNDLEKVTDIAKRMVMRYGMSDKLGPRVLGHSADMPFLGLKMGHPHEKLNNALQLQLPLIISVIFS